MYTAVVKTNERENTFAHVKIPRRGQHVGSIRSTRHRGYRERLIDNNAANGQFTTDSTQRNATTAASLWPSVSETTLQVGPGLPFFASYLHPVSHPEIPLRRLKHYRASVLFPG